MATYTVVVGHLHGWNFLTPFLMDVFAVNWSGQFNVDFTCYLILSAVWFVWRNEFTTASIVAAPAFLFGGMLVFSAYLFYLTYTVNGRIDVLLLGTNRVR